MSNNQKTFAELAGVANVFKDVAVWSSEAGAGW